VVPFNIEPSLKSYIAVIDQHEDKQPSALADEVTPLMQGHLCRVR